MPNPFKSSALAGLWVDALLFQVHGKPIPVTKKDPKDPDFEKAVDELHVKAVEAVRDVYLRHREEYG